MFKKILKVVGSFFLVSFLLLVGASIYTYTLSNNEVAAATPYLEEAMPAFTTWDYEQFSPFLSDKAKEAFESQRGQKIISIFSRLGELQTLETPQFMSSKTGVTVSAGNFDIVTFAMLGHFSNGDATITVTLSREKDYYLINHINVNSDVLFN